MRPVKRGVAFSQELQAWIYHASRLADISENRVIVRLLQIGVEDLRPFDDAGLKRILPQPWHFENNSGSLETDEETGSGPPACGHGD